jgi:hypothetical protein
MATHPDVRLPSPSALGEGLGVRDLVDDHDDEFATRLPDQPGVARINARQET